MFAVGNPSSRPALVSLDHRPLDHEGRAQAAARGVHLAGRDQRPDPGRGDRLAVHLDKGHDPGLELGVRGEHRRVALRFRAEAEVLPDRDALRAQPLIQDLLDELLGGDLGELLVEGDHHQLPTPRPSITSRFTLKGMISFGSAAGCRISSGWGSKVSTVSAPSITARWPRWTPSKVPIATLRGRGSASGGGT